MSKIFKYTGEDLATQPFVMEFIEDEFLEEIAEEAPESDPEPEEKIGTDIEALEREAYERGFAAGERAGFELGKQKAEVLFGGLEGMIKSLSEFKETLFKPCEKEMTELSLAIAKKVIQREVEIKKDGILECVRAAMRFVVASGEILIKVNPKDFDVISQYKQEILKYGSGVKGVKFESAEHVSKGGCLIETNFGEVDSTIESIMQEVEEKIRNAY